MDNLPQRPPFLSEPAFINLLFFSHCHVSAYLNLPSSTVIMLAWQSCGKPNIRKVIWKWFARYCPGCLTSMCVYAKFIQSYLLIP